MKYSIAALAILASITFGSTYAASTENNTLLAIKSAFEAIVQHQANGRLAPNITIDELQENVSLIQVIWDDEEYTFYAIEKSKQRGVNYAELRSAIVGQANTSMDTITQIIGDRFPSSVRGTQEAFAKVKPILKADQVIIYNLIERKGEKEEECINGQISSYLDYKADQLHRFVATIVNETVEEIEEQQCQISAHVRTFVLVYNNNTPTHFGDEHIASNSLCTSLHCFNGEALVFAQVLHALKQGKSVHLHWCDRNPKHENYFSVAEFLTNDVLKKKFSNEDEIEAQIKFEEYVENLGGTPKDKTILKGLLAEIRLVCNHTYKGILIEQSTQAREQSEAV